MKKVVNNLSYGQTSQLLTGRFDSEIYASGCSHLENMTVIQQGGVTRRPPKKWLKTLPHGTRLINYTIDTTNSFLLVLSGAQTGSYGTIGIYDFNNDVYGELSYDVDNPWRNLTDEQLKKVQSVVYYTDILLVHPDVPLMVVHYAGGSVTTENFQVLLPKLFVNQDSSAWGNSDIAYGMDDFKEMRLNQSAGNYASVIAVMGERLWLGATNNEPYKFWASRVAGSSQELEVQFEYQNLLDFTQFQIVESTTTDINSAMVPVKASGEFRGDSYNQKMWLLPPNTEAITTLKQYNDYVRDYSLEVVMEEGTTHIVSIYNNIDGERTLYIIVEWENETPTAKLYSTGEVLTISWLDSARIRDFKLNGDIKAEAIPFYITDLDNLSSITETSTELTLTATDSTGMEFQLSSGRNDKITWLGVGACLMVGLESALWRLPLNITALDFEADMYASYGSSTGLSCNTGTDLVFLERGNKARLIYKDYYGLQNLDLSLTNPEIMKGTILQIVSKETDTPSLYLLKRKDNRNTIVNLSLDRGNGIQGWSEWTFPNGEIVSISTVEDSDKQYLVALVKENELTYLCYFDSDEDAHFADCSVLDNEIVDQSQEYASIITTNPFEGETDNGFTFGDDKRIDKVIFRAYNTGKVKTYTDVKHINITKYEVAPNGVGDFEININGGPDKEIEVSAESYKDQPMTILCIAYDVRLTNG